MLLDIHQQRSLSSARRSWGLGGPTTQPQPTTGRTRPTRPPLAALLAREWRTGDGASARVLIRVMVWMDFRGHTPGGLLEALACRLAGQGSEIGEVLHALDVLFQKGVLEREVGGGARAPPALEVVVHDVEVEVDVRALG